jgi:hypothetical protein
MKRKQPLTEFERLRLAKRRELAEFLASTLPDDREEWVRIVTARFGTEAAKFADSLYPDRDALADTLSSEFMEIVFRVMDD